MHNKGFTLIEITIGIAIAGVMAAIAIPAYAKYITKSRVSEAFNMAGPYKMGIIDCLQNSAQLQECHSGTYSIPVLMRGKFGSIAAESGQVEYVFDDPELKDNMDLYNKHIIFYVNDTYNENTSAIKWSCKVSADMDTGYLPGTSGCVTEDNTASTNDNLSPSPAPDNSPAPSPTPSNADTSGSNVFTTPEQVKAFFGGPPNIDGVNTNTNWFVSVWKGDQSTFNQISAGSNFSTGGVLKDQKGNVIKDLDQFCPAGYMGVIGNTSKTNPSNAGLFCIKKN